MNTNKLSPPPPIILTGMHRSGTSLLGSFLNESGIHMGSDLVEKDSGNPNGYYEDTEFLNFHIRLIQKYHKSNWYAPSSIMPNDEERQMALDLLSKKGSHGVWGWKDPRSTLFLELWRDLCPDAKFLFVYRNPFSVIESLNRREKSGKLHWRARAMWLRGWLVYTRCCINFHQKHPNDCLFFSLESMTQNPEERIDQISKFLGYPLQAKTFEKLYKPTELRSINQNLYQLTRLPQHLSYLAWRQYQQLKKSYP
ncbi:sulfotransferase [Coraliomargarita algicola]|uniref:Sulfotransferase n=1 Tax=Coraliomargarita algicola TaxID=3092156 RepID=A0ABZ0RND4_9BACT|nr:sulfotransferase [Coraliomargarita sp. J2-16]WPJ97740.1 sulfotransferase [Coraliomargarita sp. J2-16]